MGTVPYDTDSTYAFIDGAYGMMNSQDLAIGESACGARICHWLCRDGVGGRFGTDGRAGAVADRSRSGARRRDVRWN